VLTRNRKAITIAVMIVATLGLLLTPTSSRAEAWGCLLEYRNCGRCAYFLLGRAVVSLDLEGFIEAVLYGLDCDIDLYHCIAYGQHHDYTGCKI